MKKIKLIHAVIVIIVTWNIMLSLSLDDHRDMIDNLADSTLSLADSTLSLAEATRSLSISVATFAKVVSNNQGHIKNIYCWITGADSLEVERIRVMAEPWGLLGIKELKNDDFDLTILQARWALRKAKGLLFYKEEE